MRKTSFSLVLLLISSGILLGQERPSPENQKLQELAGTWDAVMKFNGVESKASATYKSICSGMWLASDFKGEMAGQPFEGHGLDGYDQKKKKLVGVWVDSMNSAPLFMEGDVDPKTKMVVMTGASVGPDGKPQKFKTTTEYKDKDHFTFTMYMMAANGPDVLAFSIDYTRRK